MTCVTTEKDRVLWRKEDVF